MKLTEVAQSSSQIKANQERIRKETARMQKEHDDKMKNDPTYRDWHTSMVKHYEKKGHTEGD